MGQGGSSDSRAGPGEGEPGDWQMKSVGLFLLLFAVWLLWSGLYKPLVIGLGVISCLLCVWLTARMDRSAGDLYRIRLWRLAIYLPWLIKEIASSNWDVIKSILSPSVRVDPALVRLTASQQCDMGRVIYGNSITLTPGTLTLDMDKDQILVHALTHRGARNLARGEMDARVTRLESDG